MAVESFRPKQFQTERQSHGDADADNGLDPVNSRLVPFAFGNSSQRRHDLVQFLLYPFQLPEKTARKTDKANTACLLHWASPSPVGIAMDLNIPLAA